MKGKISLSMVGAFILMVVAVLVSVGLLSSTETDINPGKSIINAVENSDFPVCRKYTEGEEIGVRDFKTILYGRYTGNCREGESRVELGFTLTNRSLDGFAEGFDIIGPDGEPLILFRDKCEAVKDFRGITVEGEDSKILFRETETIRIVQEGDGVLLCQE
ncbi:MAG: hypothetical protein SVV03_05420 [Candidatus Nanohaloarchaea archaeon]|nr:hypothetical protein [Candidatus Nanohaloarchaea archaeon]